MRGAREPSRAEKTSAEAGRVADAAAGLLSGGAWRRHLRCAPRNGCGGPWWAARQHDCAEARAGRCARRDRSSSTGSCPGTKWLSWCRRGASTSGHANRQRVCGRGRLFTRGTCWQVFPGRIRCWSAQAFNHYFC